MRWHKGTVSGWSLEAGDRCVNYAEPRSHAPLISGRSFYDTPTRVTALDDDDIETFLKPLRDAGCEVDESAHKEIANWTGGVPVLVCALLQRLSEEHAGTLLAKWKIDQAGAEVEAERGQLLAALWDDCNDELRADLGILSDGDVPLTELCKKRRRAIEERGYGRVSRNRLRSSCRLMQHYAKAQAPAIADLTRLLGTSAGFELVWNAELPPDRTLPAQWREEWEREEVRYTDDGGRLPRSPGAQCNILRLATGTERTSRRVRYITKTTYLLLDHLQSVGNFGQHRDDFPAVKVTVGFSASVVFRRHFPGGVSDTRSRSRRYRLIELPPIPSTTPRRGRFS